MDRVESEAVNEPLNAKVLSLDTLANSSLGRKEMWREMGFEEPSVCLTFLFFSFSFFSDSLDVAWSNGRVVGETW